MGNDDKFQLTFDKLKGILIPFQPRLVLTADQQGLYTLETAFSKKYKKAVQFGSAQIRKNYVSYYFMPIYSCPELLDSLSINLKKRMQGKACFNFTAIDDDLVNELAILTQKGFDRFSQEFMS